MKVKYQLTKTQYQIKQPIKQMIDTKKNTTNKKNNLLNKQTLKAFFRVSDYLLVSKIVKTMHFSAFRFSF